MRIRVYLDPSCGGIEDESLRPLCWADHHSHMVCRDIELWDQYQNALEELKSAAKQLHEVLIDEPLTLEELELQRRYEAVVYRSEGTARDAREDAAVIAACLRLVEEG